MKNLNEEIEKINRLNNYRVGRTITEQRAYIDLENIPKSETPSSPPPKSETPPTTYQDLSASNTTFNDALDEVNSVIPGFGKKLITTLAVGLIGDKIHSMLKRKQTDELKKLISHFEVAIDDLDEDEKRCLLTKNVPIKLFNIKKIVDKEREIRVWLSTCVKDVNKLNSALSNITNIIKSYREEKDKDGYYTY